MGKLANTQRVRAGVIRTEQAPSARTYNGAAGYVRDVKSELFLLAVTNFVSESTFYESATDRDARFVTLLEQATREDPQWTAAFLYWLRSEGNMRSASIIGAIEYGRALATVPHDRWPSESAWPRKVLGSVLQRADEPGEALGYWLGKYGRPLPKWVKRALGDAAHRLYTPFATLKYDGQGQRVRFGDVVEFSDIDRRLTGTDRFKWQLDRRHGRDEGDYGIDMLMARQRLEKYTVEQRRALLRANNAADLLGQAGYTWESLSGWLQGPMDAAAWEAIIPSMGYMALLRNLRNFEQAGISAGSASYVMDRLADPAAVAKSRQLPMRFLSAYNALVGDQFKVALTRALDASLASVPTFCGRTLVLIDTSQSMDMGFSRDGSLHRWDAAALFGIAFAKANAADVVSYSREMDHGYRHYELSRVFYLTTGAPVLRELQSFKDGYFIAGGTDTAGAVRKHFNGQDRVLLLTDEQADSAGVFSTVPESVPCYTFNLAGYRVAHAPSGPNRMTVGGLTDAGFRMMSLLETWAERWPWER